LTWTPEDRAAEARLRRRYRPAGDRDTLSRLTTVAAVAAIGINILLFFQTAITQLGPGDISGALVTLVSSVFPGEGGIQAPSRTPLPSPVAQPVVTTGGS